MNVKNILKNRRSDPNQRYAEKIYVNKTPNGEKKNQNNDARRTLCDFNEAAIRVIRMRVYKKKVDFDVWHRSRIET